MDAISALIVDFCCGKRHPGKGRDPVIFKRLSRSKIVDSFAGARMTKVGFHKRPVTGRTGRDKKKETEKE